MKKFLSMVMCLFIALTPVMMIGCGGGTGEEGEVSIPEADKGKTNVYVEVKSGGTGYKWLVDAGTRFSLLKGNEVYEPGTQGVVIIPKTSDNPSINNAESSNSAIIDVMGQANIASAAREGRILPIDDVFCNGVSMKVDRGLVRLPVHKKNQNNYKVLVCCVYS